MCRAPEPHRFAEERHRGNAVLADFSASARAIARADELAYQDGALAATSKELMGLAISFAHDCEECVYYHLEQLVKLGMSDEQISEAFDVVLVGSGSVTFPIARKAVVFLARLRGGE